MPEDPYVVTPVDKAVSVYIPALDATATLAHVTAYMIDDGVYVYDLLDANGALLAQSRYNTSATAPFELTQEEHDGMLVSSNLSAEEIAAGKAATSRLRSSSDYKSMIRRKAVALAKGDIEDKYKSLIELKKIGE